MQLPRILLVTEDAGIFIRNFGNQSNKSLVFRTFAYYYELLCRIVELY